MHRTVLPVMFVMLCGVAFPSAAQDPKSDWRVEETPTAIRYELGTRQTHLVIECVRARFGGGAVVDIVVDGADPDPRSRTEVFVGDTRYFVAHDMAGVGVTDCPVCADQFEALWAALRSGAHDEITLKRGERREYLGARGGARLGPCAPG